MVIMSAVPADSGNSAVEPKLVAIEMRADATLREYASTALGVILILGAKEYVVQPAAAAQEAAGLACLGSADGGSVHLSGRVQLS